MNRELDEKLTKEHPVLFGDRYGDMRNTCLCWGFECGDGWYGLLKEAADKLEPLCRAEYEKAAKDEKPWYKYVRNAMSPVARFPKPFNKLWTPLYKLIDFIQPKVYSNAIHWYGGAPCRASQVKEKYGTLRFYMTAETKEMDAIIEEACRKSAITCEQCGKKGKLRGKGWYYTACAPCDKKRDK